METVITDEIFNNLEWSELDGLAVDELIKGASVVGSEPIDHPLTDGLIIYLKAITGKLLALDISANTEDFIDIAELIKHRHDLNRYLGLSSMAGDKHEREYHSPFLIKMAEIPAIESL